VYSNFTVSIRSVSLGVFFRRGGLRHVQRVRPNRGPTKRGRPQARKCRTAARFSGLWGHLFGVLRQSFCAARQSLAHKHYKTSTFRKPYLESGNSSETAYSCTAEFVVSFFIRCQKIYVRPTFLANWAYPGFDPTISTISTHYILW